MILVTGGAGFIGSNLVAALEERGTAVAVCDSLGQDEKWRNLAKRELADFCAPADIKQFLERNVGKLEAIVHLGAVSSTTERDADLTIRTNFKLPLELWNWCATHGVRLIYASSAATYGDGTQGFDDEFTCTALAKLRPLNVYGWSKHLFDRRVARIVDEGGPRPPQWAGLKFFNVYGPNEYHKGSMQSVVAHLYPRLTTGEPARLFKSCHPDYPDGGQLRDFVYVGDCVAVMLWLLDQPRISGLFNVGSGHARSFADLATATFDALGLPPRIEYVEMPESLREKYQYYTQANLMHLRDAGFSRAVTRLEEGVREYVQDYLMRPDPYR